MIQQINVKELAKMIANDHPVRLLDVRQLWEMETAALPESTFIPLGELEGRLDEMAEWKNDPIVVYCHHGIRSLTGARILAQAGFLCVASMSGGIDAWSVEVDPAVQRY